MERGTSSNMECPQCGHVNSEDDRFCSNCGTRLEGDSSIPRQYEPSQRDDTPPQATVPPERVPEDSTDPEWRMSSLPPEEPPKRRTWLWVLGGILIFCVLLVCAFSIFLTTGPGQDLLNDLGTRAAELTTSTPE